MLVCGLESPQLSPLCSRPPASSPSLLRVPLLRRVREVCCHPATPSRTEWVTSTWVGMSRLSSSNQFLILVRFLPQFRVRIYMRIWGWRSPALKRMLFLTCFDPVAESGVVD